MANLKIFSAGVAASLVKNTVERFEQEHNGVKCELSIGGSNAGINRLRGGEIFDVMILADNKNIDDMLMPEYADGYFIWGGNEMVVMGKDITSENWKEKLLDPNARILHMNPYNDPSGYRAVMAMKLADRIEPGLSEKLLNHPNYKGLEIEQYGTGFKPAMSNADGEYMIAYKSMPISLGANFAELPPEMNLSDPVYSEIYETAEFTIGTGETVRGNAILHAIVIPKNAENKKDAEVFAKMFLENRLMPYGFTHIQRKVGNWNVPIPDIWGSESKSYNLMTLMEANGTNKQLDCIPLEPDFVVLDCGCGTGRMAIQAAKRVKKVICLDSSKGMLDACMKNCEAAGVTNVEFVLADWQEAEVGVTIPEVDVIIQARGGGGPSTLDLLKKAVRKYAAYVMWAPAAPGLPESMNKLFDGCYSEEDMQKHPELKPFTRPKRKGPGRLFGMSAPLDMKGRVPMGGKDMEDMLAKHGIEVHSTIVDEGWDRQFSTKQEAYDCLIELAKRPELVNLERFHNNVDSFLTENEDGFYFLLPTRSMVSWFKTR